MRSGAEAPRGINPARHFYLPHTWKVVDTGWPTKQFAAVANNYGPPPGPAEENFGRALRADLGAWRDELIISTKARAI